ncbi:hypothetical protein MD484_g504, partial [Candolleomyces efflorescens]
MHDSAERCDAPKCHPETRVAVQDELVNWIEHGDEEPKPVRIVWITGPAGGGKTAIMGSTAETCEKKGLLACSFFFSSFAGSANRRLKKCLVATLAYQLVQHDALPEEIGERILSCVERNPAIFHRQLEVQFDQLILQPLREARRDTGTKPPKVILIDGLDECQAEHYSDVARSPQEMARANEGDQKEILQALLKAANDPSFPFRIIIASRPEPVIQTFFTDVAHHISKRIFLDNKYNPDADMLLFLEAKFGEIRREYKLPSSWPSQDVRQTLVENASGQFVYVATVMRFIGGSSGLPDKLLRQVLDLRVSAASANPFAPLDALYSHILNSCPDPQLTVRWLSTIFRISIFHHSSASYVRLFLESSSGEASYVFRGLNSLVNVPPADDSISGYTLFHKSLTDFLDDPSRCGSLSLQGDIVDLYCAQYTQIWKSTFLFSLLLLYYFLRFCPSDHMIADKGPATPLSQPDREGFLHLFLEEFQYLMGWFPLHLEKNFELCDVAWWVRLQDKAIKDPNCEDSHQHKRNIQYLFQSAHRHVRNNNIWFESVYSSAFLVQMVPAMSAYLQVHQDWGAQGATKARVGDPKHAGLAAR